MTIVMTQQGRRFTAKVILKIADAGGYCYGIKLHILARFSKGSLPTQKYIGLAHA